MNMPHLDPEQVDREEAAVRELLAHIDHAPPRVSVDDIVARARSRRQS